MVQEYGNRSIRESVEKEARLNAGDIMLREVTRLLVIWWIVLRIVNRLM